MRCLLLAYLGRDNLLIGFNVIWTLTELQLAVAASRVVDIKLKHAYQRWCCQLSWSYKRCVDMLVPNLFVPYDRRWPAILLSDLKLMLNGRYDIFYKLYTAAIWQAIRKQLAAALANVGLHLLKQLYKIGCSVGFVRRVLFPWKTSRLFWCVGAHNRRNEQVRPNGRITPSSLVRWDKRSREWRRPQRFRLSGKAIKPLS